MKVTGFVEPTDKNNDQERVNSVTSYEQQMLTKFSGPASFDHLRYVIAIASGLAVGLMLLARLALITAMVGMVNHTALYQLEHPNSSAEDFFPEDYVEVGEFVWTNEVQQIVISGYMITYTLPQFFTTRFAMSKGLRISVPVCLSICAASLLLTPLVAYYGWQWVLLLRLANALGASPVLPLMIEAVEKWFPKEDKATGVAIALFSNSLVFVLTPLISGYLASYHWTLTFYVPSGLISVFCIIWYLIVADSPKSSRLISQRELEKLSVSIQHSRGKSEVSESSTYKWYFMFKIPKFYPMTALWMLQSITSGGFLFLIPAYLARILKLPVDQNGFNHFVSHIGCTMCMLWSGPATRLLQGRFDMSVSAARNIVVLCCE